MARNSFGVMTGGPRGGLSQNDLDYIFGRDGATGGDYSVPPLHEGVSQRRSSIARREAVSSEDGSKPALRGTIDETAPRLRGTLGPDDPATGARAPAEAMGSAPMSMRSGIAATAKALGIDPIDLATVISYETAGTFSPTKAGPRTQWGQHKGLIQFGEPQARKYGVDWKNPMASQLGPDGAVAKYLRAAGVRPGMGIMDVYSAINAGGVGRYNRSDANNGGAPGTVADKVNNQMAGHRRKAERMFAGSDPMSTGSVVQPQSQRRQEQPSNMAPPEMLQGGGDLRSRPMPGPAQSYEYRQPYQPPQQPQQVQDYFQPVQMPQQPQQSFNAFGGGGDDFASLFGDGGGGDFWSM